MPVNKKKSKLICINYRPISLLSNIDKTIEKLCIIGSINFLIKATYIAFSLGFDRIFDFHML